ncbi:HAD family hydrolase [Clostridium sp. 1xD42-85]|uniref:HAD family hydrolase n=1 Tax=Clostridium sp. 1xD42-85 TaxID=2320084 RepID=UPI001A9B839B|nr:HAD family hydrolase [Clostridium sp. 1xD42-85]
MKKLYSTFIFDLDGTIIDSERIGLEALQATLSENGINKTINELRFSVGIPGLRTLEILNIADIPTTLEAWLEKQKPFMSNVPLFDSVIEVISQLPKPAIVTSQNQKEMQAGFYQLDIAHHFQAIVCADDTEKHKPNPDPLNLALQLLACEKENAIYIGDSIYDMHCATAAGVDFGLAAWGVASTNNYPSARYIFETPFDILTLARS